MLGIVCPSIFEYRVLDKASLRKKGALVVRSGMGKLRAMAACARLHRENPGLRHLLLVGFAGGLTKNLSVGDVVEPAVFIEQDYFAEPFEKFPNKIEISPKKLIPGSKSAAMLTQDRFLTENPYAKTPHKRGLGRIACDMESYAVAHYAKSSGIGFSVVKLISDSADENADHDFLKACRKLAPKLNRTVLVAAGRLLN